MDCSLLYPIIPWKNMKSTMATTTITPMAIINPFLGFEPSSLFTLFTFCFSFCGFSDGAFVFKALVKKFYFFVSVSTLGIIVAESAT